MGKAEKSKESWQERKKKIKKKWHVPFIYVEWICEQVSHLLGKSALFEILEYAGRLTVLVAVIFYIRGCPERQMQSENLQMQVENLRQQLANQQKAKHYQAWQVINTAQGKPGSGGRIDALQDLNSDGVSLAGVDISKAHLPKLNLENADLKGANFTGADLHGANLAEAGLTGADFTEADLRDANFTGAELVDANFTDAVLSGANLTGTRLTRANFTGAVLRGANLSRAGLRRAKLTEADFSDVNFVGADLSRANLTGTWLWDVNFARARLSHANLTEVLLWRANLAGARLLNANLTGAQLHKTELTDIEWWQTIESVKAANLYAVKNPPDGLIEWAKEQGAVSTLSEEFMIWEKREERRKKLQTKTQQEKTERVR